MKTLNSISGGRTSAYMAAHFVADYDVFVAVCGDNPKTTPKDSGLVREICNRLEPFVPQWGEFIGSPEDARTFRVVLDLEQKIGRKIIWLRGESFEAMVMRKGMLPNTQMRICTMELKMRPIAEWIYKETNGGKVLNRVGIRIDEAQRIKTEGHRAQRMDIVIDRSGKKNKWLRGYEFAESSYPLVFDSDGDMNPIRKREIYAWAESSGLVFPPSSNCQWCFHKGVGELVGNAHENREIIEAGSEMEAAFSAKKGKPCTMKKAMPLSDILEMKPQQITQISMFHGFGACESTFCTD